MSPIKHIKIVGHVDGVPIKTTEFIPVETDNGADVLVVDEPQGDQPTLRIDGGDELVSEEATGRPER